MFKSCTSLTKYVNIILNSASGTLSQQFQFSWKHISRTKALLRNKSSLDRSALTKKEEKQNKPQLQPVPRLFNALWKPVRHQRIQAEASVAAGSDRYCNGELNTGRSWLERHTRTGLDMALLNREGGHQLLAETWEQTAPTETSTGFNAITARLHKLGLRLGSRHILYGMTIAVDPSSMKQYLLMLERSTSDDPLGVDEYSKAFTHIAKQLLLDSKSDFGQWKLKSSEWNLSKCQEQWFQVLTGLTEDTLDQPKESRQFSLYDLGPRISVDYWSMYIELLGVLVGESAVYHEYLRFKQIQQPSQMPAHQTVNPNLSIAKHLLNVTVRAIAKENLCFAYAVAQQHMNSSGDIEPSTWRLLLADLDLFYTWAPKMLPKAVHAMVRKYKHIVPYMEDRMLHTTDLRELEYQLQAVEQDLGIHWSGGESGYHVPSKTGGFWPSPGSQELDSIHYHDTQ